MSDIVVTGTGSKFNIPYTTAKGARKYFPDAVIEHKRLLVESKDWGSAGLSGKGLYGKTADELWQNLRDKHAGCAEAGYTLILLVFKAGRRTRLPANWAELGREEVASLAVAFGVPLKRRKVVTREASFESIDVVPSRPKIEGWPKYQQLSKSRRPRKK